RVAPGPGIALGISGIVGTAESGTGARRHTHSGAGPELGNLSRGPRAGRRRIGRGQLQGQLGYSRGAQPRARPAGDVTVGSRLGEAFEEVRELGIAVLEPLEVQPRPGEEGLPADERDELLEHGRALRVRDAVKIELR